MDIAVDAEDWLDRVKDHIFGHLADQAYIWALISNRITAFEQEHLVDNPTPEKMAKHRAELEMALKVGRFIQNATSDPEFTDRKTTAMVDSTIETLQDMHRMWHAPRTMNTREAEELLTKAFPDESRA